MEHSIGHGDVADACGQRRAALRVGVAQDRVMEDDDQRQQSWYESQCGRSSVVRKCRSHAALPGIADDKEDDAAGAGLVGPFVRNMNGAALDAGNDRDPPDPRVQRTRASLRSAFNRLFLERGFDAITPAQIAAEAGVGRSTFYDHYAGKGSLLRQSITIVLRPLAEAAAGRAHPSLRWVVEHFWENRRFAQRLLGGRSGVIVRDRLAELIKEALHSDVRPQPLPLSMIALGLAANQLALVEAWLTGRHACTADQLADALLNTSRPAAAS